MIAFTSYEIRVALRRLDRRTIPRPPAQPRHASTIDAGSGTTAFPWTLIDPPAYEYAIGFAFDVLSVN